MGFPKAQLPFGPEMMLQRVVRQLEHVVTSRFVVAAAGQTLPALPADVRIVHDEQPGRGPLEGLAAGMRCVEDDAVCYVTSCDVPFLKPAWVQRLIELLRDGDDIVVPFDGRHHHPLAAVYRRRILPIAESLLLENRLRPFFLFQQARTRRIDVEDLRVVDPNLDSLVNVNNVQDYCLALERAGYSVEPDFGERLKRAEKRSEEKNEKRESHEDH